MTLMQLLQDLSSELQWYHHVSYPQKAVVLSARCKGMHSLQYMSSPPLVFVYSGVLCSKGGLAAWQRQPQMK